MFISRHTRLIWDGTNWYNAKQASYVHIKTHKVDLGWYQYNAKQASYVHIKTHKVDLGWYQLV